MKKSGKRTKTVKSIDEFEQKYFPKLHERKVIEAESEESTGFARRLTASIFENIRSELRE